MVKAIPSHAAAKPKTRTAKPKIDPLAPIKESAAAHSAQIKALLNQPYISEPEMKTLLVSLGEYLDGLAA